MAQSNGHWKWEKSTSGRAGRMAHVVWLPCGSGDTEKHHLPAPRKGDVSQMSRDFGWLERTPALCRACRRIAAKC